MAIRLHSIAVLLLLASAPLAAQVATNANERFDRLDVNHDGGLSKYEMDAEIFIGVLDTDGDHQIGPSELAPLLGTNVTPERALDRVRVADRNAADKLNADEIDRAAGMRFKWMDANGDGNVDRQELSDRFGVPMVGGK